MSLERKAEREQTVNGSPRNLTPDLASPKGREDWSAANAAMGPKADASLSSLPPTVVADNSINPNTPGWRKLRPGEIRLEDWEKKVGFKPSGEGAPPPSDPREKMA
jgi:hypothetical protein